ncbi:MAG: DUF4350 domain-containing protein [Verrucomicrobiae bacterium]|nr:DUF4350 domain-containing protein [Verrucomicrobiae bacterium]
MRKSISILLMGSVFLSLVSCQKTEKKRRTVGYKGDARGNAFLAAQRMLEKQGYDVMVQTRVGDLDYQISTLFLTPSSLNTVGRTKRVLRWIEGGGHLIVMLKSGEKRGNDFRMINYDSRHSSDDVSPGTKYLLDELDVELIDWAHQPATPSLSVMKRDDWEAMEEKDRAMLGAEKTTCQFAGQPMDIYQWADIGLAHDIRLSTEYGNAVSSGKGKHRYLSLIHGSGRVTLLADASPLRNRYIAYGDHARFVAELVGLSGDGKIVFTDGGGDNFFTMVWRYFWMAVIGLALVITFWLWKNLPRFGPPQSMPQSQVREFSAQVRGIGRFLWRQKRDDTMLVSLRRTVDRRLSLNAVGDHQGLFEQISERTGLPLESVIEAMTRQHVREPGVMVRVVKNLQLILKSINT